MTGQNAIKSFFMSVVLVLGFTAQAIMSKQLGYSLKNYPYFVLLSVAFLFVPLFFSLLLFIKIKTGGFEKSVTTWKFRKHFAIVGLFNALNGFMCVFSVPHVPGAIQTLLIQSIVPFTMLFSFLFLNVLYNRLQYVAFLVLVCALFVQLLPSIIEGTAGGSQKTAQKQDGAVFWMVVCMFAQVPLSLGSIYQEYAFSKAKVNVVYMISWTSLAQFVCLVLFFPLNFVPKFGNMEPQKVGRYFRNATLCVVNHADEFIDPNGYCKYAGIHLMAYVLAMLLSNIAQAFLVKYAGANLVVLILTMATPITAIAFTQEWIMGQFIESFNKTSIFALVLITLGIFMFRFEQISNYFTDICNVDRQTKETEPLLAHNEQASEGTSGNFDIPGNSSNINLHSSSLPDISSSAPRLLAARVGLIEVEYSGENQDDQVNLLFEHTKKGVDSQSESRV